MFIMFNFIYETSVLMIANISKIQIKYLNFT